MKKLSPILFVLFIASQFSCMAQQAGKDSLEGTWKGTSLCQVKPSGCHDENVVYHISKGAGEKNYRIQANKIVNGEEQDMGPLDCVYDDQKRTLTTTIKDSQDREAVWLFTLKGKKLTGSLTINGNTLFRLIEVTKQ